MLVLVLFVLALLLVSVLPLCALLVFLAPVLVLQGVSCALLVLALLLLRRMWTPMRTQKSLCGSLILLRRVKKATLQERLEEAFLLLLLLRTKRMRWGF